MALEYAKAFYTGKQWRQTQAAYMISQCYVCERCGRAACLVHHRKYITPQNIHDPMITLHWDNLEALCYDCHVQEHKSGEVIAAGLRFDEAGNVTEN